MPRPGIEPGKDLQIFSLTLSQLSYRGDTLQTHPISSISSRTHAAHHRSHAPIHRPPDSPCVLATHIDLRSAAPRPSRDKQAAVSLPRHISPFVPFGRLYRCATSNPGSGIHCSQQEPYRSVTASTPAVKIVHGARTHCLSDKMRYSRAARDKSTPG